jgi:hypothetical protein
MASMLDTQRTALGNKSWGGDISRDMFPSTPDSAFEDYDYREHLRRCILDRRDKPGSLMPYEERPNTNAWLTPVMNVHMYGATEPTDPYTDEQYDTQFRDIDPRGFSGQYPWANFKDYNKFRIDKLDWARDGAMNDMDQIMSATEAANMRDVIKTRLRSLWKRFSESLMGMFPSGIFKTENAPRPYIFDHMSSRLYEGGFNEPREFGNVANPDIQFRSLNVPTEVVDISAMNQLPSSGLPPSMISEMQMIENPDMYDNLIDKYITLTPNRITNQDTIAQLKRIAFLDFILNEQSLNISNINSWIPPPNHIKRNSEVDLQPSMTVQTLDPNVKAVVSPGIRQTYFYKELVPTQQYMMSPPIQNIPPSTDIRIPSNIESMDQRSFLNQPSYKQIPTEYKRNDPITEWYKPNPMERIPEFLPPTKKSSIYSTYDKPYHDTMANTIRYHDPTISRLNPTIESDNQPTAVRDVVRSMFIPLKRHTPDYSIDLI